MSEWKDIKTAPKNKRVRLGWYTNRYDNSLVWWESIGVAVKTYFYFFKDYHYEATHWKELPQPPKEQEKSDDKLIGSDGKTWPQTFDADIWAKEFVARNPDADLDKMRGWFANAIMLGYDTYRWRHCSEAKEKLARFGAIMWKCCGNDNIGFAKLSDEAHEAYQFFDSLCKIPGIKEAIEELTNAHS